MLRHRDRKLSSSSSVSFGQGGGGGLFPSRPHSPSTSRKDPSQSHSQGLLSSFNKRSATPEPGIGLGGGGGLFGGRGFGKRSNAASTTSRWGEGHSRPRSSSFSGTSPSFNKGANSPGSNIISSSSSSTASPTATPRPGAPKALPNPDTSIGSIPDARLSNGGRSISPSTSPIVNHPALHTSNSRTQLGPPQTNTGGTSANSSPHPPSRRFPSNASMSSLLSHQPSVSPQQSHSRTHSRSGSGSASTPSPAVTQRTAQHQTSLSSLRTAAGIVAAVGGGNPPNGRGRGDSDPSHGSSNLGPIQTPIGVIEGSGDGELWQAVYKKVAPLFNGERLKVSIEELNEDVSQHIRRLLNPRPNPATGSQPHPPSLLQLLSMLNNDIREIIALGCKNVLQPKILSLPTSADATDRLLQRLTEIWRFYWTSVVPYLEGLFLPCRTDERITRARAKLQQQVASSKLLADQPVVPKVDVRQVALIAFRDHLILPMAVQLATVFEHIYGLHPRDNVYSFELATASSSGTSDGINRRPTAASLPSRTPSTAPSFESHGSHPSTNRSQTSHSNRTPAFPPSSMSQQAQATHANRLQMINLLCSVRTSDEKQKSMEALLSIVRTGMEGRREHENTSRGLLPGRADQHWDRRDSSRDNVAEGGITRGGIWAAKATAAQQPKGVSSDNTRPYPRGSRLWPNAFDERGRRTYSLTSTGGNSRFEDMRARYPTVTSSPAPHHIASPEPMVIQRQVPEETETSSISSTSEVEFEPVEDDEEIQSDTEDANATRPKRMGMMVVRPTERSESKPPHE